MEPEKIRLGLHFPPLPPPTSPHSGADPGFFSGGGALVSCSTSTPINHIFFLQNTSCIRKPQVNSGGGGAHPLHPPPRSAPATQFAKSQLGCSTEIWSQLRESQSFVNHFKICCLQEEAQSCFLTYWFWTEDSKVKPITCYHVIGQQQANFFSHISAFNMLRLY